MSINTFNYKYDSYISNYNQHNLKNINQEEVIDNCENSIGDLPSDIKKLILSFFDIPQINSCLRLSKDWNKITDAQWDKIGKKFKNFYDQELSNKEQIKKFISLTHQRITQEFAIDLTFLESVNYLVRPQTQSPGTSLNPSLKEALIKLSKSVRIDNIDLSESLSEALNTFIIGDFLQYNPGANGDMVYLNFENFNSFNEVFYALKDLMNWCNDNQVLFSQMRTLEIKSRNITSLSCKIFDFFPNLKSLNLEGNRVSLIQKGIEKSLPKLEYLNLSKNKMTSFPVQISHLTTLKTLKLGKNEIPSLPIEILQLKNLEDLDLRDGFNNKKISVPDEFWQSHLPSVSKGIPTKDALWWMINENNVVLVTVAVILLLITIYELSKVA